MVWLGGEKPHGCHAMQAGHDLCFRTLELVMLPLGRQKGSGLRVEIYRLAKDCEKSIQSAEAWVLISHIGHVAGLMKKLKSPRPI